jgi:hypothetical protein
MRTPYPGDEIIQLITDGVRTFGHRDLTFEHTRELVTLIIDGRVDLTQCDHVTLVALKLHSAGFI